MFYLKKPCIFIVKPCNVTPKQSTIRAAPETYHICYTVTQAYIITTIKEFFQTRLMLFTMTNSPIDEYFGNEMEYIKRGLSQLDLMLECKEKRIIQLTEENNNLKMFTQKLQAIINQLQLKLDQAQQVVRISDFQTENEKNFNELFSSL